jgi:hypothetical protein
LCQSELLGTGGRGEEQTQARQNGGAQGMSLQWP